MRINKLRETMIVSKEVNQFITMHDDNGALALSLVEGAHIFPSSSFVFCFVYVTDREKERANAGMDAHTRVWVSISKRLGFGE